MIWLKENEVIVGYVPFLKKEYTENSIREMSKYSCYDDWSKLSELVMKIQGIGYSSNVWHYYEIKPKRLIDISFDFEFECFLQPNAPRMDDYLSQIFDVFENLTFYRVGELSKEKIYERIEQIKQEIELLVSDETLLSIYADISKFNSSAEIATSNLQKLQKMFAINGYTLSNNLFVSSDAQVKKDMYKKRRTKKVLKY